MPVIGFLGALSPSAASQWTAAFVQRLRELGWIEGRTIAIAYRWAEGRSERFAEIREPCLFSRPMRGYFFLPASERAIARSTTALTAALVRALSSPGGGDLLRLYESSLSGFACSRSTALIFSAVSL